jgi:transcriptional regulator with XRE-family HTH domain
MPFRPDRLKALREVKGLSQEQLGLKAGLHHSVITKSEKGRNSPRSDALDKLAEALDCTIDYLHGRGPEYDSLATAASQMALDVAQRYFTDEQRERCHRAIRHSAAPKTSDAWRSFVEMTELALGQTSPTQRPFSMVEKRTKSKPPTGSRPTAVRVAQKPN